MTKIKRFMTYYLGCFLTLHAGFSQNMNKPVNSRFFGGEKAFTDFMQRSIKYPVISADNNSMGFSVSSISISPDGKIVNISIINSIDKPIDAEVIRLLKLTRGKWKKNKKLKSNQTFYVQIAFICSMPGIESDIVNPDVKNEFFIEPVSVTAYSLSQDNLPVTNDTLFARANVLINSREYEEALPYINELIKRNPFSKELSQYRILIYRKTNKKKLINQDVQKINSFIPGTSLDEITGD